MIWIAWHGKKSRPLLQFNNYQNLILSSTIHRSPKNIRANSSQKSMATLHLTSSPSFALITPRKQTNFPSLQSNHLWLRGTSRRNLSSIVQSYKVLIEHEGKTTELEVDPDETILSKALDSGMYVPHDCKLGVCMTCPARLLSGTVDQSDGMLSDDVVERGYALLCAAYPRSDCHIRTIPEEELLSLQLATAND